MTTPVIANIEKTIAYDRMTKDYSCTVVVDGAPVFLGYAPNYSAGEIKCNEYVYDMLVSTHTYETAAELVMQPDDCPDCDGEGRTPNGSCTGDTAGGWADTCDTCRGTGKVLA